jgi:hypothetical protein
MKKYVSLYVVSSLILLRMRNVSDKGCRENQNTALCSVLSFSENHAVCEIMRKSVVNKRGLR